MWPYIAIGLAVVIGIIFHDLRLIVLPCSISDSHLNNPVSPISSGSSSSAYATPKSSGFTLGWQILFYAIITALILMAGLRYRIGMDTIVLESVATLVPDFADLDAVNLARHNGGRFNLIYSLLNSCGVGLWPWFLLCAVLLNGMFALRVAAFTRFRFTALGFYLAYSYMTLNFETMIAGVAAGALLWAFPDIYQRRYGRFCLKLACGALFHLSVLLLFWLPILGSAKVRKVLTDWRWLIIIAPLALCAGMASRIVLPWFIGICDNVSGLTFLGFSSDYALPYADFMLAPENLNLKGYLGVGFRTVAVPILAAWLILRGNHNDAPQSLTADNVSDKSVNLNSFFASILIVIALIEIVRFEVTGFSRMSMLIWPIGCIALARSLNSVKGWQATGVWSMAAIAAVVLCIKGFCTPIELTGERQRLELYVPYAHYLSKGVCYRREWLAYEHVKKDLDYNCELDPIYDFGFELRHDEHEIPSVFHPDCIHENMEQIRQQKCGADSIAPVIPFQL